MWKVNKKSYALYTSNGDIADDPKRTWKSLYLFEIFPFLMSWEMQHALTNCYHKPLSISHINPWPIKLRHFRWPWLIFTGSIAHSAIRLYLSYSEADFEVIRPKRQHIAPMGRNLPRMSNSSMPNFTHIGAKIRVQDPQNWNFYCHNWDYNPPQGSIACAIFTEFAVFVACLRMRWL